MRFLHVRVHADAINERAAELGFGLPGRRLTSALVFCPRCNAGYMSEPHLNRHPWAFERQEFAAAELLETECPDHPHAFELDS